jgi:Zn-finger nucleic acid-binding protein
VCTEPLIVIEIESIEMDHCAACGGVWLDSGELEILLDGSSNRDALMASLAREKGGKEEERRCPICAKNLEKVIYGTDGHVLLDICPRRDGLWFDRGELHDVIKMGDFPADHRVYELIRETFGEAPAEAD